MKINFTHALNIDIDKKDIINKPVYFGKDKIGKIINIKNYQVTVKIYKKYKNIFTKLLLQSIPFGNMLLKEKK